MSDVAASGGYYIAMPAHAIVAEPSTLTGSIGVVLTKFVIDGTLKKLGHEHGRGDAAAATPTSIRRCAPSRPKNARKVQEQMQATYDTFVEKAAEGRQHDAASGSTRSAQGRVWTGAQGEADRPGRRTRRPRARARGRQAAREDPAGQRSGAGRLSAAKKSFYDIVREPVRRRRDGASALGVLLGFRDPRALQPLTAPLRVFRRGEPLAMMPNVFIR